MQMHYLNAIMAHKNIITIIATSETESHFTIINYYTVYTKYGLPSLLILYSHQISIVVKINVTLNSVGDGVEFENALNNTCCLNKYA